MGQKLLAEYTQPRVYTGELIGVEYLFSQTGAVLEDPGRDPDAPDGVELFEAWVDEDDEGFEDALASLSPWENLEFPRQFPILPPGPALSQEAEEVEDEDVPGPDGRGGGASGRGVGEAPESPLCASHSGSKARCPVAKTS